MDHVILHIQVRRARHVRRRHELYRARIRRYMLRDASDPFSTPERQFRDQFRLPRALARQLVHEVTPFLREAERASAIPSHLKVLCALQFFAHGSHQTATGKDFDLALSQSSVSRCIEEVTNVMSGQLLVQYVKFPTTYEERGSLQLKNFRKCHLMGVLGYVDGTHIALRGPVEREDLYVNRKNFHSINVQITCDVDMLILNVLARFPGSTHDSHIWASSALRDRMEALYRAEEKVWLLGDSGYPQEPWLHIPIMDARPNTKEAVYTRMHTSARSVVERCIGVLKGRFQCLLTSRSLKYHPIKVGRIVNSCTILHNWCIKARLPDPEPLQPGEDDGSIHEPLLEINAEDDGGEENLGDANNGRGGQRGRRRPLLVEGEQVRQQYLINPIVLPNNVHNGAVD